MVYYSTIDILACMLTLLCFNIYRFYELAYMYCFGTQVFHLIQYHEHFLMSLNVLL